MAKFKELDIVVGSRDGWQHSPSVILGEHTFPGGQPAYRMRHCVPEYCLVDGAELWSDKDFYMQAEYVDEFTLLWRKARPS